MIDKIDKKWKSYLSTLVPKVGVGTPLEYAELLQWGHSKADEFQDANFIFPSCDMEKINSGLNSEQKNQICCLNC